MDSGRDLVLCGDAPVLLGASSPSILGRDADNPSEGARRPGPITGDALPDCRPEVCRLGLEGCWAPELRLGPGETALTPLVGDDLDGVGTPPSLHCESAGAAV